MRREFISNLRLIGVIGIVSMGASVCVYDARAEETCWTEGPSQFADGVQYCVSSVLPSQGRWDYGPKNLVGYYGSVGAWCEGVRGAGVGETISIRIDRGPAFRQLALTNGYAKSKKSFSNNGRAKRLRITSDTGIDTIWTLKDKMSEQIVPLPKLARHQWLKLKILDVYPGKKFDDTCIDNIGPDFVHEEKLLQEQQDYSEACLPSGTSISGRIDLHEETHPAGYPMRSLHLIPQKPLCIVAGDEKVDDVRRIQLAPISDQQAKELHKSVGQTLTIKGAFFTPHTAWHTGDVLLNDINIIAREPKPETRSAAKDAKPRDTEDTSAQIRPPKKSKVREPPSPAETRELGETSGSTEARDTSPLRPTFSSTSSAPTQAGLSLKQLMLLLGRHPEPDARVTAAEALGMLGAQASPATAALQAATYDEDPNVRAAARKALQQLLGTVRPRPTLKPALATPVKGRIYFLMGFHKADEDGIQDIPAPQMSAEEMVAIFSGDPDRLPPEMLAALQKAIGGESPNDEVSVDPDDSDFLAAEQIQSFGRAFPSITYEIGLAGIAKLYYLDLEAAAAYRREAAERGLQTDARTVREILESDPERTVQQRKHRIFRPYKRDHVVRAATNGQIKFLHRRYFEGEEFGYGGAPHLGMLPGDYQVDYTIYTVDGERLRFKVPLNVRSMNEIVGGLEAGEQQLSVRAPSEVAKTYRQKMAALDMSKPNARKQKSDHALSIAYGLTEAVSTLTTEAGAMAHQIEPFLAEAVAMHELAAKHGDKSWSFDHGKVVMHSADATTQETFDLALKETRLAEQWAETMDPKLRTPKANDRWGDLGVAYKFIAHFHISHSNDVTRSWTWLERVLNLRLLRQEATGQRVDSARERATWPQLWWRKEWNEDLPVPLQGDIGDVRIEARAGGVAKPLATPRSVAEQDTPPNKFEKLWNKLNDDYQELKDEYERDSRWMEGIASLIKGAYISVDEAWKKLTIKREAISALQARVKYLKSLKAKLARARSDDYLEDFFQWGIAKLGEFQQTWNYEGSDPPKKVGQMREVLDRIIAKNVADIETHRQEQDALIKERIERFQNVLDELESRGQGIKFKRVVAEIADQRNWVKDRMEVARAQLLCAAGKNEFRHQARKLIAEGKSIGMMRYLEGMHFLQKQDARRALHAFRAALLERVALDRRIESEERTERAARATAQARREPGAQASASAAIDGPEGVLRPDMAAKAKLARPTSLGELEQLKKAALLVREDPDMKPWTGDLFEEARDKALLRVDPARYWVRKLELEYLHAIDNKAMGEAAMVRDATWTSLSKHGEKGYWGGIKDLLTSGATGSGAAIIGLHETIARDQGTVLTDAASTHIGIGLITRLRERGYGLGQIQELSTRDFVQAVSKEFNWELKNEDARRMVASMKYAFGNPDLKILCSWSKQSMDVESGKKYYDPDDFSTAVNVPLIGTPWGDIEVDISDIANVKNVALFFGPNALVQRPGFMKGIGQFANHASQTERVKDMVTLKEVFARGVGLQKVANAIGGTKMGAEAMRSLLLADRSMTWLGKAAVDASMMMVARESAEFLGRAGSAMVTGWQGKDPDKESEEYWANAFGEAATYAGAFGLADYDVTVSLSRAWQRESLRRASVKLAQVRLGEALEMDRATIAMMRRHQQLIDDGINKMSHRIVPPPPIKGAGRAKQLPSRKTPPNLIPPKKTSPKGMPREKLLLEPGAAEPFYRARAEIQGQVEEILYKVRDPMASPTVMRRLTAMKTAYNALEALDNGLTGEARTWKQLLQDARDALQARTQYDTLTKRAVRSVPTKPKAVPASMQGAGAGRSPQSIAANVMPPHEIDYGPGGALSLGNRMMRGGAYPAAKAEFEEMAEVFKVIGDPGNKFAREAVAKINEADGAIRAAAKVQAAARTAPKGRLRALAPITDQDLDVYQGIRVTSKNFDEASGGIWHLERASGGITHPKKVFLRVGRVGGGKTFQTKQPLMYFKPSRAGTLDAETEEVFSWFAQKIGLKTPSARVGDLTIDGKQVHGVFVRNFEGEPLANITIREPGMRHAFSGDVADDLPLRIFAKDWDPHAGNFKVNAHGAFGPYDRNGGSLIDHPLIANDPKLMRAALVEELKSTFWSKGGVGRLRHYWDIAEIHKHVDLKRVERSVSRLEAVTPAEIKAKIDSMDSLTAAQKKLAKQGLLTRRKVLRGAVQDYVSWVNDKPLPPMPAAPDLGSMPWLYQPAIKAAPPVRPTPVRPGSAR